MKITEILIAEHSVFHSLFDHIEATVPEAKTLAVVKALAVAMEKLTRPHSETEDELFIKPLEHYFDQIGHHATFHDEHELIERALAGVLKTKDLKLAKKLLLGAVLASRRHFDKEERTVFPMAERVLKVKTLTELGKAWRTRRDGNVATANVLERWSVHYYQSLPTCRLFPSENGAIEQRLENANNVDCPHSERGSIPALEQAAADVAMLRCEHPLSCLLGFGLWFHNRDVVRP